MAVSVENTSTLGRRLTMRVSDEAFKAQCKSEMAKVAKEMHSPGVRFKGFRPGKMPASELQKRFSPSVRKQAIQVLVDEAFQAAMKQNGWQPIDLPRVESIKEEPQQGIECTLSFEIYPTITLADLSNVVIEKRVVDIVSSDVDNMIVKLCDQLAEWEVVERAVQEGDKLKVDFTRRLKGAENQEEQKDVQMSVGGKGVVPGLNEALLGKKQGDHIEIEIRYPSDWGDQKVADQEALLGVTILEVTEKKVLTAEALKKKLEVEDLQEEVKKRMQQELESVLREELKETVLEKLLEENTIELPPSLIQKEKEAIHKERGKKSEEEIEEEATRRVELGLLLNEVIKKYEVKVDEQRLKKEVERIAASFPNAAQVMQAYYRNHQLLHGVERRVLLEEAVDKLLKEFIVNEKKVEFDAVMNPPEEQEESREGQ